MWRICDAYKVAYIHLIQSSVGVLLQVDIDWEMGIHVTHFILVAAGDSVLRERSTIHREDRIHTQ